MAITLKETEKEKWNKLLSEGPSIGNFEYLLLSCSSESNIPLLAYGEILKLREQWTEKTMIAILGCNADLQSLSEFNWDDWYEVGLRHYKQNFAEIKNFPPKYLKKYPVDLWEKYRDKNLCIQIITTLPSYKQPAIMLLQQKYMSELKQGDINKLLLSEHVSKDDKDFFWGYFLQGKPSVGEMLSIQDPGEDRRKESIDYLISLQPKMPDLDILLNYDYLTMSAEFMLYILKQFHQDIHVIRELLNEGRPLYDNFGKLLLSNEKISEATESIISFLENCNDQELMYSGVRCGYFGDAGIDLSLLSKRLWLSYKQRKSSEISREYMTIALLPNQETRHEVAQHYMSKAPNFQQSATFECLALISQVKGFETQVSDLILEQKPSQSQLDETIALFPQALQERFEYQFNHSADALTEQLAKLCF